MLSEQAIGSKITVKARIQNVTFPRSGHRAGDFTIFKAHCELLEGEYPEDLFIPQGDLLTFTGEAPELSSKEEYRITAEFTINKTYGGQYKIILMNTYCDLSTPEDQRKFLEYVLTERQVDLIFQLTENPVEWLESGNIKAFTQIKGIGVSTAQKIIDKYNANKMNSRAYIELYNYGITKTMLDKLVLSYGSADTLIEKIKENAYILIEEVTGIGWEKADLMARANGMAIDAPERIRAYIFHYLNELASKGGNTLCDLDELAEATKSLSTEITNEKLRLVMLNMLKGEILYYDQETRRVGLSKYRQMEEKIARELMRIQNAPVIDAGNIGAVIQECQEEVGYTYSDEQVRAIKTCLSKNICIITALAGCGKSSMMFPVVKTMHKHGLRVAQCALSGKAALNLTDITHIKGETIHKLLGWKVDGGFLHNKQNPLPYDMIILDEVSMVPEDLFLSLLLAIPRSCKLILIGDAGQLEPIGVGCVLKDLCKSEAIPHHHLTHIFRQAAQSGIIMDSLKVYDQRHIVKQFFRGEEVRGELQDFKIIGEDDVQSVVVSAMSQFKELYFGKNIPIDDIMVITAKRTNGDTSSRNINTYIQKIVNNTPTLEDVNIYKTDNGSKYMITVRPGDRILITQNCYDTTDELGNITPIFNGNVGTVKWIDKEAGEICAEFSQGIIVIHRDSWNIIELGYAITCHKCQGSGIPYVIVICDHASYILLSKEWLYTALTRAKKECTLICQPSAVRHAVETTKVKEKRTWLCELVVNEFLNSKKTAEIA